jgi:hypothetical protein
MKLFANTAVVLTCSLFFLLNSCSNAELACVCGEVLQPVCGSDGQSYANPCYAECAGVTYSEMQCEETLNLVLFNDGACGLLFLGEKETLKPDTIPSTFLSLERPLMVTFRRETEFITCKDNGNIIQLIEVLEIQ